MGEMISQGSLAGHPSSRDYLCPLHERPSASAASVKNDRVNTTIGKYGIICFDGVATAPIGPSTWNPIICNRASLTIKQYVQRFVRKYIKPLQEIQYTSWFIFRFLTVASSLSTPRSECCVVPKIPFSGSDTCKIGERKPSGKYVASKRRRIEHDLYKQDPRGTTRHVVCGCLILFF